ncbi:Probable Co/Zn/Cd efflux system membrane fusion protein, partial [hydrothermal vent metagenome]
MSKNIMVVAVIMLAAGLGGGYWLGGGGQSTGSGNVAKTADTSAEDDRKLLFYRNPMNPSVTSPVPAKDAMGMDYI